MGAAASTGLASSLESASAEDLKTAAAALDPAAKAKILAALKPKLKLYTHRGVPNPDQITFYAAMAGCLDMLEEIDVDVMGGENRKPEFLAKNPSGSVPALQLPDGTIIGEVVAICQYLDEVCGPSDVTVRLRRRAWRPASGSGAWTSTASTRCTRAFSTARSTTFSRGASRTA